MSDLEIQLAFVIVSVAGMVLSAAHLALRKDFDRLREDLLEHFPDLTVENQQANHPEQSEGQPASVLLEEAHPIAVQEDKNLLPVSAEALVDKARLRR